HRTRARFARSRAVLARDSTRCTRCRYRTLIEAMDMSPMHSQETWVNTARGRLFVKSWQADTVGPERAPIIMQHDSLGCVTLWRDLPERLALATGRRIVAYDRLGFGRSDPHPDRVGFDLVHAEATGDFRL